MCFTRMCLAPSLIDQDMYLLLTLQDCARLWMESASNYSQFCVVTARNPRVRDIGDPAHQQKKNGQVFL